MKIIGKEKTTTIKEPQWQYKLYITNDATVPNVLVESLAPMNGSEFLNRDVDKENEDDLINLLVPDNFYIVGKRLVKYHHLIPNVKVIVCELARLTPENFLARHGMQLNHKASLDEQEDAKNGKKKGIPGEVIKNIRTIKEGEKINV